MKVLKLPCFDSFEVKGSKFLCYFEPFTSDENVRVRQEKLRLEHPKCVHVVYASRVLNVYGQIVENQSDDGEPKGSSGAPALNVLRGAEIVNAVCYIVRYFGGTLLGVGGLVRAYSKAVNLGIEKANELGFLADYIKKETYKIRIDYSLDRKFSYILDSLNIVYEKDFSDFVDFKIFLSSDELCRLNEYIVDMRLSLNKL